MGAKELAGKYERKMKVLRDDLELRRKQDIHEVEERKNAHIQDLMKKHEKVREATKNSVCMGAFAFRFFRIS